jgi:oxygen-independent coproporphyrinogen-3 oxidase
VARDDIGFEFMLNALRLADGVPSALFAERTGYPISLVSRALDTATRKGLLEADPARIKPTELGRRFQNDLLELFLPRKRTRVAPLVQVEATGVER